MDVMEKLVKQAISHFWYGVSHDIFSEPVTTYAKLAIEALKKENGVTVQEWIPVTERLPKDGIRVLVLHDDGVVRIGISRGYFPSVVSKTHTKAFGITEVTHWMPLPQPPKGE